MNADHMRTLYARVDGMYCAHCEQIVSLALRALDGVKQISFRQNTQIRIPVSSADAMAETFSGWGGPTGE